MRGWKGGATRVGLLVELDLGMDGVDGAGMVLWRCSWCLQMAMAWHGMAWHGFAWGSHL